MATRKASCLCTGVSMELTGEPVNSVLCHCVDCKKASGSSFMANDMFGKDQLKVLSGKHLIKTHTNLSESNDPVLRSFCGECGSPLFIKNPKLAEMVIVPSGIMDGESGVGKPREEYFCKRRVGWMGEVGEEGKRFEGMI